MPVSASVFQLFTFIFTVSILSGCGGGGAGGSSGQDGSVEQVDPSTPSIEQSLTVDVPQDLLRQLSDDQAYYTVSESGQVRASDAEDTPTNKEIDESELVLLASEFGEPMALGIRHKGERSVTIDLTSSAVVFVLRHERFFGVEFEDLKAVESRIQAHPQFPALVEELQAEIDAQSPCPMNPNCSFLASMTADEIAVSLSVNGLQVTTGGGINQ